MNYAYKFCKNRIYCHHFVYAAPDDVKLPSYLKNLRASFPEKAFIVLNYGYEDEVKICFKEESYASLFKLVYAEEFPIYLPSILIPILRRVMPTIIANEIIGVSPMTGPRGDIFSLGVKCVEEIPPVENKDCGIKSNFANGWSNVKKALTDGVTNSNKKDIMEKILENTKNFLKDKKP